MRQSPRSTRRVLITTMLMLVAAGAAAAGETDLAGAEAPDFVLRSFSGPNVRLSEYRGHVVILSFWASWCGDCRAQLESLAGVYDRYHDAGFDVLAVNLDRDPRQGRSAVEGWQAGYPILYDAGGEVGRRYDVGAMPLAVLVDRDGIVREVFHGYRRGQEPYLEKVRALLRE
jgi:peroxiredoxin